jgi:hypothetical protein
MEENNMPMYTYKCECSAFPEDVIKPMSQALDPAYCALCNRQMHRDYQIDLPHASGGRYSSPIVSDSLAVSIDQIAEHKRAFPDIQITKEGQPVLEDYKQHQNYLDKCGFAKMPKKQRVRGKKISTKKEPTPST